MAQQLYRAIERPALILCTLAALLGLALARPTAAPDPCAPTATAGAAFDP